MSMKSPADAFRRILEVFDRLEIAYLVGGSVASAVHGISRPTMDVDFVAAITEDYVEEFAAALKTDFYADPEMMRDSIRSGRPFNLIHFDSPFKYVVFPLPSDQYSRTELARRRFERTSSIGDEPIECAVATAEDTILTKLRWYRAGGETSERQWNDLRGILKVSGAALDAAYLKQWAPQLGVNDLLDKLLEES
jgi:hypothetical protein